MPSTTRLEIAEHPPPRLPCEPRQRTSGLAIFRALSIVSLPLALLGVTGCGGEIGLHVIVSIDWASSDGSAGSATAVDHVQITATQGQLTATACLFPRTFGKESLIAKTSERFACANLQTEVIDSGLTQDSWGLDDEEKPRTINFVFPSDGEVEIAASAGFGGHLDIYTASSRGLPGRDFPDVDLKMVRNASETPYGFEQCLLRLSDVATAPFKCGPRESTCLLEDNNLELKDHTAGAQSTSDGCAIFNAKGSTRCATESNAQDVAFAGIYSYINPRDRDQILPNLVRMRARFIGCEDGLDPKNCKPTVDCTPPKTWVTAAALQLEPAPQLIRPSYMNRVDLSCLAPTMAPIEFELPLAAKANVIHLLIIGQEEVDPATPKPCALEILSVDPD